MTDQTDDPDAGRLRRLLDRLGLLPSSDRERHGRDLLAGTPFVICIVSILGLLAWTWLRSDRELPNRYRAAAARATDDNDLATARLCYERLVRTDRNDRASAFGLALTLARAGDTRGSIELLDALAPLDDPSATAAGFAPAHLALGRELLATTRPSPRAVAVAERHLRSAVAADVSEGTPAIAAATEAHAILGRLYSVSSRWELARAHLAAAITASKSDELALMLARVCVQNGKPDEATAWAKRSAAHWARRVDADPRDVRARVAQSESLALLGDHAAAIAALERGLANLPDDPALKTAAAQACATWIAALERAGSRDAGLAVDLVQRGLTHDPENAALLERLAALARPGNEDPARADKARALMTQLLVDGRPGSAALLHLALGTDAFARGQTDAARLHYERAYALAPRAAAVANNLAYVLAFASTSPADDARALSLADSAVTLEPTQPRFRDTRGQIYTKLGRWKDAIADLELALPSLPDPTRAHAALAECYQRLGLPDLAAAHRARAARGSSRPTTAPSAPTPGSER